MHVFVCTVPLYLGTTLDTPPKVSCRLLYRTVKAHRYRHFQLRFTNENLLTVRIQYIHPPEVVDLTHPYKPFTFDCTYLFNLSTR